MAGKANENPSEAMPSLLQAAAMGIVLSQGWQTWSAAVAQSSSTALLLCGGGLLLGIVTAQKIGAKVGVEMPSIRLSLFWLSCMMSGGLSAISQLRLHSQMSNSDSLLVTAFMSSTLLGCCLSCLVGQALCSSSSGELLMPSVLAVLATEAACNNSTFPSLKLLVVMFLFVLGIFGMANHGYFGSRLVDASAASSSKDHASEVADSPAPLDPFFPATALSSRQYSPHFMVSQRAKCLEGRDERLVVLLPRASDNHARPGKKAPDGGKQRREKQKETFSPALSGLLPDDQGTRKLSEGPVVEDDAVGTEEKIQVSEHVSEFPDPLSVAEVGEDIRWNVVHEEMQRIDSGPAAPDSMADQMEAMSEDAIQTDIRVIKKVDHHTAAQERLKAALAAAAAQAAEETSLREPENQTHQTDEAHEVSAPLVGATEAGWPVHHEPWPVADVLHITDAGQTKLNATAAVFVPQAAALDAPERSPEDGMNMPFVEPHYGNYDAYPNYDYGGMEPWSGMGGWGDTHMSSSWGEDGPFAGDGLDYASQTFNVYSGRGGPGSNRKGKGSKGLAAPKNSGKGFGADMLQLEEAADAEPVASLFDSELPDVGLGRTSLARKGADRLGKGKNRGKTKAPETLRISGLDETDSREYIASLCSSWGPLAHLEIQRRTDGDVVTADLEAFIEFSTAAETTTFLDACRQSGGLMTEDGKCLTVTRCRGHDNRSQFPAGRRGLSQSNPAGMTVADLNWAYIDPNDKIQSGFNSVKMRGWFDDGYFKGKLLIALVKNGIVPPLSKFRKMEDCYDDVSKSFLCLPQHLCD